jgi:putative ATPase
VAGLIARSGGSDIQRESVRKAPVPTGHATHTTAGSLPFKYIIHTVGPIWRGGMNNEPELLASAVRSALTLADQLGMQSVSMPSISTGIFGYPLEPAIKIIETAIVDFMKTDSAVSLIHLCEFSEEKAEQIKNILNRED